MTTNIIRHDRGIDSKRIEKIIELISRQIEDIKYDRRDVLHEQKKKLKQEIIDIHGLQPHYDAISEIDTQIDALEDQIQELKNKKNPYKVAIARIMKGSEDTWNYNEVRDGSPADHYMQQHLPNISYIKKQLNVLESEMEEQLWLAKDIEEARVLYHHALDEIQRIAGNIKGESK